MTILSLNTLKPPWCVFAETTVANSMGSQQQSEGCWVFSGRWMLARPWSMSSQECLFAARVPLVPLVGHWQSILWGIGPFWYGWPGRPLGPFSPCNLTMAHQVSFFFPPETMLRQGNAARMQHLSCARRRRREARIVNRKVFNSFARFDGHIGALWVGIQLNKAFETKSTCFPVLLFGFMICTWKVKSILRQSRRDQIRGCNQDSNMGIFINNNLCQSIKLMYNHNSIFKIVYNSIWGFSSTRNVKWLWNADQKAKVITCPLLCASWPGSPGKEVLQD